jgi:inorganic pyrophosphatase
MKPLDVVIEIPKGSRNKYEWDETLKAMRFSRMLFSSVHYPCDYGFFPDTLAQDGDPLDCLVLVHEATFPGCVIKVRPIGVLRMKDQGIWDYKVLCVPITDPHWNHLHRLGQVTDHLLDEIEHFFQVYKNLEHKKVQLYGWGKRKEAVALIRSARKRLHGKSIK